MSPAGGRRRDRLLLPLALGITDGILNALTLASATVLHGRGLGIGLAVRVGLVAFVSALFTVFVAEYGQLRGQLARAEHELSLTVSGRLAQTNLGRMVTREAAGAALVASTASFIGAIVPLLIGFALRTASWSALVVAVTALGGLGALLANTVGGRKTYWITTLTVGGVAVAAIGNQLNIT